MTPLDLLAEEPLVRASSRRLTEALTFCFARGDSEERLLELCAPLLAPTTFRAECFSDDLFVDELIAGLFPLEVEGRRHSPCRPFHKLLITSPPARPSLELRHRILRELSSSPEFERGMGRSYEALRRFRSHLAGVDAALSPTGAVRRRVEILTFLREAVDILAESFAGSTSDLRRVVAWVDELRAGEAWAQLEQLLAFEDTRAVLESRLSVGYDGTLRRFEIIGVERAAHPAFPRGAASRWLRSLIGLLKGYRFSEEDVMSQVLDSVFSALEGPISALIGLSLQFEFYLGALGFRRFAEERGHSVCLPEFAEPGAPEPREIRGLFNPWLVLSGTRAVASDVVDGEARSTVIITGPNSGGKTRLLQALAVTQLLGQVGLFVPAKEARLVWVEQIFLSLLERVEASQSEGRLGMELLRIRRVFETSGPRALIIMDELCSGTNPSEGEQIFEMVLGLLAELRPQVLISTHFLDFAERLSQSGMKGLSFRQVELGERDLPTYQFVPGVARTSLAKNTAARLGVTRDELLDLVEVHRRREAGSA